MVELGQCLFVRSESLIKQICLLSREQLAVAVVHSGQQAGAGTPHTVSRWDVHLRGQKQRGTDTERLLPYSAG